MSTFRIRNYRFTLLFIFVLTLHASPEDWRIALCISENPTRQMNVAWRTEIELDTPSVQVVLNSPLAKFNETPVVFPAATEIVTLSDSSRVYAYSGAMKNLHPGTSYAYRVGGVDSWSEWLVFTTAAESADNFRFLYFGDPQNGLRSHVSRAFRAGYKAAPDAEFITMAGDLVSVPDIDQQWEDFFHAGGWIFGQVPQVPVMGNHAYYVNRTWGKVYSNQWRPHFKLPENGLESLPETNYYFHYQGLLFVVLNGSEQLDEQAVWLDEVLSREKSVWVVLSLHQPLYATGDGRDGERQRTAFLLTIDKHEVDLVLQGHDHTFGRTYPLREGAPVKKRQKGTVYIVSVSGSKQYKLNPKHNGLFEITGADTQFYHIIDVESRKLILSSYSVDGVLVDELVIKPSKMRQ